MTDLRYKIADVIAENIDADSPAYLYGFDQAADAILDLLEIANLTAERDALQARVAELGAERDKFENAWLEAEGKLSDSLQRAAELEAKLAKATKTLQSISTWREDCHEYDADCGHELRGFDVDDVVMLEANAAATLAEIQTA